MPSPTFKVSRHGTSRGRSQPPLPDVGQQPRGAVGEATGDLGSVAMYLEAFWDTLRQRVDAGVDAASAAAAMAALSEETLWQCLRPDRPASAPPTAGLGFARGGVYRRWVLSGNRLCLGIGRPHVRNRPHLIVDLESQTFWQKCMDPECQHFRSGPFRIPAAALREP